MKDIILKIIMELSFLLLAMLVGVVVVCIFMGGGFIVSQILNTSMSKSMGIFGIGFCALVVLAFLGIGFVIDHEQDS